MDIMPSVKRWEVLWKSNSVGYRGSEVLGAVKAGAVLTRMEVGSSCRYQRGALGQEQQPVGLVQNEQGRRRRQGLERGTQFGLLG